MIKLQEVSKSYDGVLAVDSIDISVQAGEIFGVIGPSGAGKSTLIRCVNLLERPTSGKVLIEGVDLTSLNPAALRKQRRQMGMIFQHFNLLHSRTVYDNIALPLRLQNADKKTIEKRVGSLLELTGLTERKDAYPSELSGGQKQRVAIARALSTEPKVLLCDEATSALDPQTTHSILQLLKQINTELGVTMMLITHEMSVVKEVCHRLAILMHGKIVEQAEVLEFFSNPKTDLAKNFIRKHVSQQFPESIRSRLEKEATSNTIPLLRLSFVGKTAEEPLIAHLMQKMSISLNILLANVEMIRDQLIGTMVLEAEISDDKQLNSAIQYLTDKGVNAEVIGYVRQPD